jgi:hypothetical protein
LPPKPDFSYATRLQLHKQTSLVEEAWNRVTYFLSTILFIFFIITTAKKSINIIMVKCNINGIVKWFPPFNITHYL